MTIDEDDPMIKRLRAVVAFNDKMQLAGKLAVCSELARAQRRPQEVIDAIENAIIVLFTKEGPT